MKHFALFIACLLLSVASYAEELDIVGLENISVKCYVIDYYLEDFASAAWWLSFGNTWVGDEAVFLARVKEYMTLLRPGAPKEDWDAAKAGCDELRGVLVEVLQSDP